MGDFGSQLIFDDHTDFFLNTLWNADTPQEYQVGIEQFNEFINLFETPVRAFEVMNNLLTVAVGGYDQEGRLGHDPAAVQQLFELATAYFKLNPTEAAGQSTFFLEQIRQFESNTSDDASAGLSDAITQLDVLLDYGVDYAVNDPDVLFRFMGQMLDAVAHMDTLGDSADGIGNGRNPAFLEEWLTLGIVYTSGGKIFLEPSEGDPTFGLETLFYADTDEGTTTGAAQLDEWFEGVDNLAEQLQLIRFQTRLMAHTAENRRWISGYHWNDVEYQPFLREFSQAMLEFGATYARMLLSGDQPSTSGEVNTDDSSTRFLSEIFELSNQSVVYNHEDQLYESLGDVNFYDIDDSFYGFWEMPNGSADADRTSDSVDLVQFSTRLLDAVSESTTLTTEKHDSDFLEALLKLGRVYAVLNVIQQPDSSSQELSGSFLGSLWTAINDVSAGVDELEKIFEGLESVEEKIQLLNFETEVLEFIKDLPSDLQTIVQEPDFVHGLAQNALLFFQYMHLQGSEGENISVTDFLNTSFSTEEQEFLEWLKSVNEFKPGYQNYVTIGRTPDYKVELKYSNSVPLVNKVEEILSGFEKEFSFAAQGIQPNSQFENLKIVRADSAKENEFYLGDQRFKIYAETGTPFGLEEGEVPLYPGDQILYNTNDIMRPVDTLRIFGRIQETFKRLDDVFASKASNFVGSIKDNWMLMAPILGTFIGLQFTPVGPVLNVGFLLLAGYDVTSSLVSYIIEVSQAESQQEIYDATEHLADFFIALIDVVADGPAPSPAIIADKLADLSKIFDKSGDLLPVLRQVAESGLDLDKALPMGIVAAFGKLDDTTGALSNLLKIGGKQIANFLKNDLINFLKSTDGTPSSDNILSFLKTVNERWETTQAVAKRINEVSGDFPELSQLLSKLSDSTFNPNHLGVIREILLDGGVAAVDELAELLKRQDITVDVAANLIQNFSLTGLKTLSKVDDGIPLANRILALENSGRITGLDDWVEASFIKGRTQEIQQHLDLLSELKEAERLLNTVPGSIVRINDDIVSTGQSVDSILAVSGNIVRYVEVKTLRNVVTKIQDFSGQIKRAVPKFKNLSSNFSATKEVSIYADFPNTTRKLGGVILEYSSSGSGRLKKLKPNGEVIQEINMIEDVLKNLNNSLKPEYIDHLNIYSKADNKPIAIIEKVNNIWEIIYQRS